VDGILGFWGGFFVPAVLALTCGTIFLMWIGEQITEYGVGNGISLLIMAGILRRMERWAGPVPPSGSGDADAAMAQGALQRRVVIILYLAVSMAVVYVTKGSRRIPIQYARMVRGPRRLRRAEALPAAQGQPGQRDAGDLLELAPRVPRRAVRPHELGLRQGHVQQQHASWTYTSLDVADLLLLVLLGAAHVPANDMAKNMKEYGRSSPASARARRPPSSSTR
jgi:hypothetical protein